MRTKLPPMRFVQIGLVNWKNFSSVDVELQQRVFLVGPNASGKSNFLDAFRFLRDLASPGGGFREAVRRRGGVSAIRCLSARRDPNIRVRAVVATEEGATRWEYELCFHQDAQRRPVVKEEIVRRDGETLVSRPDEDDRKDPERLTQTYLEQVYVNLPFRSLVHFFGSVYYLHIVPQLVREPDRSVGRARDPFGGDFLEQLARTPERTLRARLRRIRDVLRVAVPQLAEIELQRDEQGTPHLRGKYEHWRPRGAWQTESQFSDGTLRLIGLLWALMDEGGPLLLEEPELSLHPGVVRYLPQMFARVANRLGKQIILSTSSPDLLSDAGIGLDEVLLLIPGPNGTEVKPASAIEEVRQLLEGGLTLADAVIPQTEPRQIQQLALFEVR